MNIKEYILSGIVESYVLGLASEEERVEFEKLCLQYPELIDARNSFEISLERQVLEEAPEAPAFAKQKFIDFIKPPETNSETNVVSIQKSIAKGSGFRWLAAASIIFVIISAGLAYKFYSEAVSLKSELQTAKESQASLDNRLRILEDQQKVINDPKISVVNLTGMPKAPAASASIYWDSTSSNVWLLVKNLPQLPDTKQYQLWALIDGKPKDLGLFDLPNGDHKIMIKMNNTQKADAFAITIENRGNKGGPNLDELQTMGKIKL
ncbi:MAG: anti-sigma factor [Bacteroidetes bacterium]|nr:anti-sigma factor [Bacteroidota bacterium]